MRFAHCFEDVTDGVRIVERYFDFFAVGVGGLYLRPIGGRGAVFGNDVHDARDADVVFRRSAEQRDEDLLLDGEVDARPPFFFSQAAFVEIFFHQRVIGFGDILDELFV